MSLSIQRITPGNKIHQLFQNGQSGTSAPSKVGPSSLQTKIFIKCRFPGSKKSEVSPKNAIHYIILLNRVTWRLHFKYFFCPKTGDSFLKRWKITNSLLQIFFQVKKLIFCAFDKKNWKGCFDNIETFRKGKSGVLEKYPRNRKFYHGSPSGSNKVPSDQSQSSTLGQPTNGGLGSQIILIWNNSCPRKWEQRYSFCQILNSLFP